MTDEQIELRILDEGYSFTTNSRDAIYILRNGKMIDGEIVDGFRGEDHRIIECLFDDINRYTPNFWSLVHDRTGVIDLVPETKMALKMEGQIPTGPQQKVIESCNYQLKDAFPLVREKREDKKIKLFDANQVDLHLYLDTDDTLTYLVDSFLNLEASILERADGIYVMNDESNVYNDVEELPFTRNGYNRCLYRNLYVLENDQTGINYVVNTTLNPDEINNLINLSENIEQIMEIKERKREDRER